MTDFIKSTKADTITECNPSDIDIKLTLRCHPSDSPYNPKVPLQPLQSYWLLNLPQS